MERKVLKNKPLIEAIFEVRWELQENFQNMKIDPYYTFIIGTIYEKIKEEYPVYEKLPTANIPDEIASYVIQHRFRKDENEWPLIQIGPGIITLNSTDEYIWEDYEKRIHHILETLFEVYPEAETNLNINCVLLRYIDAIDFNYEDKDIFKFLKEHMKVNIEINGELFNKTNVANLPLNFDLMFSFPIVDFDGILHLRFVRGKKNQNDSLIWETQVECMGENVPNSKDGIFKWVDNAHKLTDKWFFKMIEGELLRRFE